MKKLVVSAALFFGLAGAALADPVEGVWKTEVDDGAFAHVDMAACGDTICGVIARTFNSSGEYQSPNLGKRLVWDMKPEGNGKYSSDKSGKIWRPANGKTYRSKMGLSNANTLIVQGCLGPICPKQTWTRVQ